MPESPEERAFVAALKAFDVPRLKTLIDAGTMSLDDLKDFKTRAEQLLARWEWRMDRGMSFNEVLFYIVFARRLRRLRLRLARQC
jgi:hypothetical protein